jgi:hypothetical protein
MSPLMLRHMRKFFRTLLDASASHVSDKPNPIGPISFKQQVPSGLTSGQPYSVADRRRVSKKRYYLALDDV